MAPLAKALGLRPADRLRRRRPEPAGQRPARRRRRRRRLPRPARGPHAAGPRRPRRGRDHRPRRGRPHGRPRLPARRAPDPGHDARATASGCCSRPRSTAAIDVLVKRFLTNPVTHEADSAQSPVSTMAHHVLHVTTDGRLPVLRRPHRRARAAPSSSPAPSTAPRSSPSSSTPPACRPSSCTATSARTPAPATWTRSTPAAPQTLVATDIAARGIHVDDVALVIHADPPVEHKAYLHRSGRTARAGADGTVVTLMTDDQVRDVRDLTRKAGIKPTTTRVRLGHPLLPSSPPASAPSSSRRPSLWSRSASRAPVVAVLAVAGPGPGQPPAAAARCAGEGAGLGLIGPLVPVAVGSFIPVVRVRSLVAGCWPFQVSRGLGRRRPTAPPLRDRRLGQPVPRRSPPAPAPAAPAEAADRGAPYEWGTTSPPRSAGEATSSFAGGVRARPPQRAGGRSACSWVSVSANPTER